MVLFKRRNKPSDIERFKERLAGDSYAGYKRASFNLDKFGTNVTNYIRKVNYRKPLFNRQGVRIPTKRLNRGLGRRGRPRGSLDPRYAAYGGVYGYRKYMAQQRTLARIQAERQAMLSPQEQQRIAQFRQQQMINQQSPESQVIPSTDGRVRLKSLHDEADDAANILP